MAQAKARDHALQKMVTEMASKATPVILPEEIEKVEFLGSGQFGSVWKGKCRGMDVAIKYLEHFDREKLRDFLDEVRIMASVLHPHVVLLLGACTTGPTNEWCMVTELCERGDLENMLYSASFKLSLLKKFSFAIDLCLGLSWLNGKEIRVTHHDLKPANVFVSKDWRCKVGDFGLAWLSVKDKDGIGVASGGSPLYESPESLQVRLQLASADVYSEQSDVWSYSVVVWEIFNQRLIYSDGKGNLPFSSAQHYYQFLEKGGMPPVEGIPPPMAEVLKKCWKFNSAERPRFQELLPLIRHARINYFLPPALFPDANQLWRENWLDEAKVPLTVFVEAIGGGGDTQEYERLLKILFWQDKHEARTYPNITLPKFQKLLYWFGWAGLLGLLPALQKMTAQPWFYGVISSKELGNKLNKAGQYLVRVNEGGNKGVDVCPFYIVTPDKSSGVVIKPLYPSKKLVGHFYVSVPSHIVSSKYKSKEKETVLTGPEPGIISLVNHLIAQTKKVYTLPVGSHLFQEQTVRQVAYM